MLSQADSTLVHRDRDMPGLALLLDPDALAETLDRALPKVGLVRVETSYVRYKPGTNCLTAFTIVTNEERVTGYAKAYHPGGWRKLRKAAERTTYSGPLGPGRLILDDQLTEVSIFPNDNKLKALGRLFDERSGREMIAQVFPDRPDHQNGAIERLRYKPERRVVVRLDVDGEPQAVLKLYSRQDFAAARCAAETLGTSDDLLVESDRHRLLAFRWRDGEPLADRIDAGTVSEVDVHRAGAALAELHGRNGCALSLRDRGSEAATIVATSRALAFLHPSLEPLVRDIALRLIDELLVAPTVHRAIHGDFYASQVLVDDDSVSILDLDQAVVSDPAADLGLFIAHLERDALRGGLSAESIAPFREALLHGYGKPIERVDLYTAVGLLQLAPHHFRSRELEWPERTEATLTRALEIICSGLRSRP